MRRKNDNIKKEILQFVNDFFMRSGKSPTNREIAEGLGYARSLVQRYLVAMNEEKMLKYEDGILETVRNAKFSQGTVMAPFLGYGSCGIPLLEEQYVEEYFALPTSMFGDGPYYVLKANGDSMINAGIEHGDFLIIRQEQEPREGDIVVALLEDGTTTVKRFFHDSETGGVFLKAENPAENSYHLRECNFQGVVVYTIKPMASQTQ